MKTLFELLKITFAILPFVALSILSYKINLNKSNRGRQFLFPFLALIYVTFVVLFINNINALLLKYINFLTSYIPFLSTINWAHAIMYLSNFAIILGFFVIKSIFLLFLNSTYERYQGLYEATSGIFYEYNDDLRKWTLKVAYGEVKKLFNGFYISAICVSSLLFIFIQKMQDTTIFIYPFYPVFGIIVLGEIFFFLNGLTKMEFVEDVLGEDEESFKVVNYSTIRKILRSLFPNRVIHDSTLMDSSIKSNNIETIDNLLNNEDREIRIAGVYFEKLVQFGESVDSSLVSSTINLLKGKSVLFNHPFYNDLANYIFYPMNKNLMKNNKVLVIVGQPNTEDDVIHFIKNGLFSFKNIPNLWKIAMLSSSLIDAHVGILSANDIYNLDVLKANDKFLGEVGFVVILEPSKILTTGQIAFSLVVSMLRKEKIVYAAIDRNCDGLVDALSHAIKTSILEVTATIAPTCNYSEMFWNAEGGYMHHNIFPNISRYLGIGSEIAAVALKSGVSKVKWFSFEKFPVLDMRWILGQYYQTVCKYSNLTINQENLNEKIEYSNNLWNSPKDKNSFLIVEDEYRNLFELARNFATRCLEQGFVNIISEDYLLREYMQYNYKLFTEDAKAIPTIVSDFARTRRNITLKIIMMLSSGEVLKDDIETEFLMLDIETSDIYQSLKDLINLYTSEDDIKINTIFKEEFLDIVFESVTRTYYSINKNSSSNLMKMLKNAYYIAEDEKGDKYYVGARLYGHLYQSYIPGQFATFGGKYYEILRITSNYGVLLRRAAEHITARKYYRQIREINLGEFNILDGISSSKTISDIKITNGYADINIKTNGYLDMDSNNNFQTAYVVNINDVPDRNYKNKNIIKIHLPNSSEKIRYTVCLLLNELFKTVYPNTNEYLTALTLQSEEKQGNFEYAMYKLSGSVDEESIYIIEDSEIDLGLIVSFERNISRFIGIITEFLTWHQIKSSEADIETEASEESIIFEPKTKPKKTSIFVKKNEFFKGLFKKKKKEELQEIPLSKPNEYISASAPDVDISDNNSNDVSSDFDNQEELASMNINYSENVILDIDGEDDETLERNKETKNKYSKSCYLLYGFEEIPSCLDIIETLTYLKKYGFDKNALTIAREKSDVAKRIEETYDPNKAGTHFCDFCGSEITGAEFDVLSDRRERCSYCTSTAVKTVDQFRKIFKDVIRNMEAFYGIKINTAIKVRTTNAKQIAKYSKVKFVATSKCDARVLGFAKRDSEGYSIYVENGAPKLAVIATIAHELTHIWQYLNWDDKQIVSNYGKENSCIIYEGMAKWVELQYLYLLNEVEYAKREEINTCLRQDEYGKGFNHYISRYPFSMGTRITKKTPFSSGNKPL
jgi:hypothetical protein